ncbi:hypothetical protein ABZ412_15600 [Nocardia sp. NPDC005746]|uniref:hypothetical protein n=1 Tax=Nocardia sp. NPDC005746 TaxID=3157062 RepID=UPI0033E49173
MSTEDGIAAAVARADAEGLEAVSMNQVAVELAGGVHSVRAGQITGSAPGECCFGARGSI